MTTCCAAEAPAALNTDALDAVLPYSDMLHWLCGLLAYCLPPLLAGTAQLYCLHVLPACTAREVPADDPEAALPLHGPNQWPREDLLPGFRATVTAYFEALTALGHKLLRLLALSLKMPGTYDH